MNNSTVPALTVIHIANRGDAGTGDRPYGPAAQPEDDWTAGAVAQTTPWQDVVTHLCERKSTPRGSSMDCCWGMQKNGFW